MLTPSATLRPVSSVRPLPAASLALTALAVGIALIPGAASALEFERSAVAAGQLWRVLTSHWTHFGPEHLFWDTLAFAVLAIICERRHRVAFVACTAASAIAIPLAVALTSPHLTTYRGLSGIDSALFALAAVLIGARAARDRDHQLLAIVALAGVLFSAKVIYEFVSGATLFAQDTTMTPVPWAHMVGGLIGLTTAAGCALRRWRHGPRSSQCAAWYSVSFPSLPQ